MTTETQAEPVEGLAESLRRLDKVAHTSPLSIPGDPSWPIERDRQESAKAGFAEVCRDNLATILEALRSSTVNDELVEAAWRPIETAPYSETVEVRAGSMIFLASLHKDGSLNSDEMPCDQWVADVEGEHPPCWTDGACWESNSNEMTSLQPVAWRPVNCAALRAPDETARLRERVRVLEEALNITRGSVGDLRRGFADSVTPARWVDQLQAHIDAALSSTEQGG